MALVYDEPQIDYEKHSIDHDTYEQFGYGDHICVECPISKQRKFNQELTTEEQCEEVNQRTTLSLKHNEVVRIHAHDRVVDVWFHIDDNGKSLRNDSDTLSSGVVEMEKPTIIKKDGSQWVGCNLDYEPLTDTFQTKKELQEAIGASGSKGIGRDQEGKIYMVFYDHETLLDAQESIE